MALENVTDKSLSAEVKCHVIIPGPVLFPVVVPAGEKPSDEIEYSWPDRKFTKGLMKARCTSASKDMEIET